MQVTEQIGVQGVAALIMAAVVIGVAAANVLTGFSSLEMKRAEVDANRLAQALEVADHRPGIIVRLNFDADYQRVELNETHVTLTIHDEPEFQDIFLSSTIAPRQVADTDHVCVTNDGTKATITLSCGIDQVVS